jgi:hypothetical protein
MFRHNVQAQSRLDNGGNMILLKKAGAVLSICLFALMLIGQSTRHDQGTGPAYATGRLFGLVIVLAGLFYSTRWLLVLSGRKYKVGRQAFAILWCVESVLGILVGFVFLKGIGVLFGSLVVAVWSVSFWLTYRWLSKLRREELTGLLP